MIARETRVLLRHYLEQGVSKAAVARKLGISERTVYRWIAAGQLDRDLGDGTDRYGPRRPRTSMLDPYKRIIDTRLAEYPELSAVRLFQEVRAAGYPGGYGQVKRYVRQVRPRPAAEPVQRFETPPGHQGQVDFAQFRLPWGQRHALIVVLGYSRLMWLQYYERQTMAVLMRGLESAFHFFQGVPSELLFDQMKAVIIEDGRETGGQLVENPEFIRFGAHWGFRIRACRPYRGPDQGQGRAADPLPPEQLLLWTGLRFRRRSQRTGPAVVGPGGQRPDPRHAEAAAGRPVRGGAPTLNAFGSLALPTGGPPIPGFGVGAEPGGNVPPGGPGSAPPAG